MLSPIQLNENILSAEYYFATLMDLLVDETMQLSPVDEAFISKVNELYYSIEAIRFLTNRGILTDDPTCLAVYQKMMDQLGINTTLPDLTADETLIIPGINIGIPTGGEQGPQGPQGPQGIAGPQGPQGPGGSSFSGTTNYIPKFTSPTTQGNSLIYDNGSGVCVGSTSVLPTAALQVDSTSKGFLPPRMTLADRLSMVSPEIGLMIYQTDSFEGVYVYKSTGWRNIG